MITITVARLSSGQWIGVSCSDRWNLMTLIGLGREAGLKLDINRCENRGQVERLRRTLKGLGFTLRVRSSAPVVLAFTPAESGAFRPMDAIANRAVRAPRIAV